MMRTLLRWKGKQAVYILFGLVVPLIFSGISAAEETVLVETKEAKKLQLVVGKSIILKSSIPAKSVSIAEPKIADWVSLSPYEFYITGKAPGITNLTLRRDREVVAIYDLEVAYDISRLKQKLHDVLPGEGDIRVIATDDSVTLSGTVSSTANLSQALALAKAYAPDGRVNNFVQVAGVQQVMLEVRVAEMSRSLTRRLGINFNYVRGGDFLIDALAGLTQVVSPENATLAAGPVGLFVSPAVNALFSFNKGGASWTGFLDALREDGLVKILAEPTLTALSGQTANFLVGGEFPVPVPQGLGTVAIEYKPFGVGLSFTPTVLSANKIGVKVVPEVSELDFSTAVRLEGFLVPGVSTRRASTMIELADGQSFAIAGLLKETIRDVIDKFPLLGDIPILGALFRSHEFQKNETELIIVVTPHLVKPLDLEKQSLPTDHYMEPTDTEFYIEGLMEGRGKNKPLNTRGEFDGQFGHAIPGS